VHWRDIGATARRQASDSHSATVVDLRRSFGATIRNRSNYLMYAPFTRSGAHEIQRNRQLIFGLGA